MYAEYDYVGNDDYYSWNLAPPPSSSRQFLGKARAEALCRYLRRGEKVSLRFSTENPP